MFKKGIGYLLLCCFLNVLTTLPAKCCEGSLPTHAHNTKTTVHSLTVIQYLFDALSDESAGANTGSDFHCSVFNEARRHTAIYSTPSLSGAGNTAIIKPVVALINYTGYFSRKFTLPQHHNFLFRLTPF